MMTDGQYNNTEHTNIQNKAITVFNNVLINKCRKDVINYSKVIINDFPLLLKTLSMTQAPNQFILIFLNNPDSKNVIIHIKSQILILF